MASLYNIFSKKSVKEKKIKKSTIQIIVDTREKQSMVVATLFQKQANIELEKLDIGDYLIEDTIIERKTFSDFVSSMISKRLTEQLTNLKKYKKQFLILEGFDYDYKKFNVHENAIRGMLLSVALDFQIPIIYTEDEEDTANFLILTAKRYERPNIKNSLRQSKTLKSLEDQKKFILEGFPGVGPTLTENLLKEFKSLKNIFNASEEQLEKIPKFDENKRKKFKELLD